MTETTRKRAPREPKTPKKAVERESRPAYTPEAREQQLISLAVDLAERQLREGTASPSVINHYLKLGSTRETIERQILEEQAKLTAAKTQNIAQAKEQEQLTKLAINAMKNYSPGQ